MTTACRRVLIGVLVLTASVLVARQSVAAKRYGPCSTCTSAVTLTPGNGYQGWPDIAVAFWGTNNEWAVGGKGNVPTMSQLFGQALSMTNTPYFSSLGQYGNLGGLGSPRLDTMTSVITTAAPNGDAPNGTFFFADIPVIINEAIASGGLPIPSATGVTIYVVFVPNSDIPQDPLCVQNDCAGDNSSATYTNGTPYMWAVVSGDGTFKRDGGTQPPHSQVFAHEVAEALTGYENISVSSASGCPGIPGSTTQVSDICACQTEIQNSYVVPGYWSANESSCVIPDAWGSPLLSMSTKFQWTSTPVNGFPARQFATGGGGGIVATDATNDLPYLYPGAGSSWPAANANFGTAGAMFSYAGLLVGKLQLDPIQGILQYNTSKKTWVNLGVPVPGEIPTGIAVIEAPNTIVATDMSGLTYFWDTLHSKWAALDAGPRFIQIAATGAVLNNSYAYNVIGLPMGREGVEGNSFLSNGNWVYTGTSAPYDLIVANPDAANWGALEGDLLYPLGVNNQSGTYLDGWSFAVSNTSVTGWASLYGYPTEFTEVSEGPSYSTTDVYQPIGHLLSSTTILGTACTSNTGNPQDCVNESAALAGAVQGCASGPAQDVFGASMVGCGGSVSQGKAAQLCGSGYHLCSAEEWTLNRGSELPSNNYWTSDTLQGAGSNGDCEAALPSVPGTFSCGVGSSMVICSGTAADRYGNICGMANCGYNSVSPDQYLGGCASAAGAACCSGCASAQATDAFGNGMVGCGGHVAHGANLCAPNFHVCSSVEWSDNYSFVTPGADYWTSDTLPNYSGTTGSCQALPSGGTACSPASDPMRVCFPSNGAPDAYLNTCTTISGCGLMGSTNEYMGGCGSSNATAGDLCCPGVCTNGPPVDVFNGGNMVGCGGTGGGSVSFGNASSLCAAGWHVCSSVEWVNNSQGRSPSANYWTSDNLGYGPINARTGACYASLSGTHCASGEPMHVCTPYSQPDEFGNGCYWFDCGLNSESPNEYFGGCYQDASAGTLCCY